MTRALLWDIDGTLLATGGAGMIAWARALEEVTGSSEMAEVRPDGLTDHQIGAWLLQSKERPADAHLLDRLVSRYEDHLGRALPLKQGRVLDHVREILDWLRVDRHDVFSALLTGNTVNGAALKLRHYGLDGYFGAVPSGAFSEREEPRAEIARRAWALALEARPGLTPGEVVVIGDTPHDIACAHAIDARALAVASHVHSRAELAACNPWMVLDRLPPAAEFTARLFPRSGP